MADYLRCRAVVALGRIPISRMLHARTITSTHSTTASSSSPSQPPKAPSDSYPFPSDQSHSAANTHFKITLRRSAISLGDKINSTVKSLGLRRRFQTVYFPHSPEVAGKILRIKELVEVENVPTHMVMTNQQQKQARKAPRGYKVIGSRTERFMNV